MWRNKYILTALLLCIISLASFGIVKAGSISTAQEGDFVVMTSFYPMYIATMNITDGVDGVEVKNLTNNATGCLHDYQLSTKDLKQLDKADMLIVNGGGMESFLEDVYSQYGNLTVVTATDGVNLLASTDGHEHSHADEHDESEHADKSTHDTDAHDESEHTDADIHDAEEHDNSNHIDESTHDTDEHGNSEYADGLTDESTHDTDGYDESGNADATTHDTDAHSDSEHDSHDHGEYNAHSWIDISLYIKEVENIADALIENNPENASYYTENLNKYKEKLQRMLDETNEIKEAVSNNRKSADGVVVFHEAFDYLEDSLNLNITETINMDDNSVLSAAQIGDIIDDVNSGNVKYILADETYGKAAAEAVKKECDVNVIYIDPLTSGESDKDAYVDGMHKNLELLKEAFTQ